MLADGGWESNMFINYEHENYVYNITIERRDNKFFITYDNNEYTVTAEEIKQGQLKITLGDRIIKSVISEGEDKKYVFIDGNVYKVKRRELTGQIRTKTQEGDLNSPISGTIVDIKVAEGYKVKKNDVLMVIEAMKMEYLIRAPHPGTIKKVFFKKNDQIEIGQLTVEIIKEDE
ncbi:MAG: biotin/lipoyl-containing protein [Thermoplasmatota archaeon]